MKILFNKTTIKHKKAIDLLCISIFLLFFSVANSKEYNSKKISLNLINTPLKKVLSTIESKSDYNFFYQNNTLNLKRLVTIKVSNENIENILQLIFNEKTIIYKIINKKIILKRTQQVINGILKDSITGEIIPFVNINLLNSTKGTSSNEIGEFEIKSNLMPTSLVFSHINYRTQTVTIKKNKPLTIKLRPLTYELEEIAISNEKDFYAYQIAKKAFRRADINSRKKKYGKAYYRQKSKNGKEYSEFAEIIYDVKYSTQGVEDWDIIEGRYAIKGGIVFNRNFTFLSIILKSFQPNSEELIFPFRNEIEKYYKVRVIERTNTKDGQIAVIVFTPFKRIKSPILEATAYINIANNQLLKLTATVKNDQFNVINFKDKSATKKNYQLTYEMAFKNDKNLNLLLDYLKVEQKFDYYKKNIFKTHVTTSSLLSFFDHYTPSTRKKVGRQFKQNESDWQRINAMGYNEKFWKENPIVKRTSIETEIISAFEKNNAFESIFRKEKSDFINNPFLKFLQKKQTRK